MKKLATLIVTMLICIAASAQQSSFERGWNAYFDRQDYDEAFTYMMRAVEEDSQNGKAWMMLGDLYLRKNLFDESLDACGKALTLLSEEEGPQRAFVYVTRGDVYSKQGDHNRAIAEYEQATKANPGYANNFMKVAEEYIKMEKFSKALEWCKKAREVDPEAAYPMVSLGQIYLEQGRRAKDKNKQQLFNEAMLACKLCVRTHPDYSWGYSTRAEVNYELGNTEEALEDVSKAYAMNPANQEAWLFLIKMAQAHPQQLIKKLEEQQEQYPDNDQLPYIMGIAYELSHNYRKAVEYYQKVIDEKAEVPVIDRLTHSLAHMGLFEEAIPLMNYQAKRNNISDEQRFTTYYSLVSYMLGAGKKQEAVELADSLIGEYPTESLIYITRANARWKTNDLQGAIEDYSVALTIEKDNLAIYSLRGRMYHMLGMEKEAKADFKKVIQLDTLKSIETVFAYCYLGQKSKAQKAFKKYLETEHGATDHYNQACAYSMLGNSEKALEALDYSIRMEGQFDFTHMLADPDLTPINNLTEFTSLVTLYKNLIAKDKKEYKGIGIKIVRKIQKANVPASIRDAFTSPNPSVNSSESSNETYRRLREAFKK